MSRVPCSSCQSMVLPDEVHSCFDAALHVRVKDAERAVLDAALARLAAVERYNALRREGRPSRDALVLQADSACETLLNELGTATIALRALRGGA